jgi:endonuclease/exonuclease/phosphatase family metal-dependent hydrolase
LHEVPLEDLMTYVHPSRIVGLAALLCSSCSQGGADEPLRPDSVMTWNLYLGAEIERPLKATTMSELAERVESAWTTFQANDFTKRAEVVADRIAEEEPSLIALQEVVSVYLQPAGDRMDGGSQPAQDLVIDFEQVLLAELVERGLDYRVAGRVETADVEVPGAAGEDIRLIDHNVTLVRSDVVTGTIDTERYTARLPILMPDGDSTIEVIRGYVSVEVTLRGVKTLFVNTHLEIGEFAPVQVAQAGELLARFVTQSEPIILVGDFNSKADPKESTETYDLIEEAGYTDAWTLRADPSEPGDTCCQAENLRNTTSQLDGRIDQIWLLGTLPAGTPDVHVVGEQQGDRTPDGVWPSDHAGVVAIFTH